MLAAPVFQGAIRDPVGIYLVPLLLNAPLMAISAVESTYLSPLESWEHVRVEQAALFLAVAVFGIFLTCVAQALTSRRTAVLEVGPSVPLESDFRHALRRSPAYLAVTILLVVIVSLGLVFLILPGFFALYLWSFAPIACALEDKGVIDSMRRSRRAVRGQAGRWTASLLLLLVVYGAVSWGIFALFELVPASDLDATPLASGLLQAFLLEVVTLAMVVAWTSLYLSFRTRADAAEGVVPAVAQAPEAEDDRTRGAMLFE